MQINSYSERKQLNIDTFERAIVYSALLLRSSAKSNVSIFLKNIFGSSGMIPYLAIEIILPYNQSDFLKNGGDLIESILEISDSFPSYLGKNIAPTVNNSAIIPEEPLIVNNLEKYLCWSVLSWIILAKQHLPSPWENFAYYSILEGAKIPSFSAKILLEFDYLKYGKINNLIECVIPTVLTIDYTKINSLVGSSFVSWNNSLFGNTFLIGN